MKRKLRQFSYYQTELTLSQRTWFVSSLSFRNKWNSKQGCLVTWQSKGRSPGGPGKVAAVDHKVIKSSQTLKLVGLPPPGQFFLIFVCLFMCIKLSMSQLKEQGRRRKEGHCSSSNVYWWIISLLPASH